MLDTVFLDRDQTLNVDKGYSNGDDEIVFVPGVCELLVKLKERFSPQMFIVTNQAGIAKEKFEFYDMLQFNFRLLKKLSDMGLHIIDIA